MTIYSKLFNFKDTEKKNFIFLSKIPKTTVIILMKLCECYIYIKGYYLIYSIRTDPRISWIFLKLNYFEYMVI